MEKKLTACISPKTTKEFATPAVTRAEIKTITTMKEHESLVDGFNELENTPLF